MGRSHEVRKGRVRPALSRTDSLPPAEKARLVQRLSSLVGLPASFIEEKNLRLSAQDWLLNILKDKGLRVSRSGHTRDEPARCRTPEQAQHRAPPKDWAEPIGTAMQAPALVPGSDSAIAAQSATRTMSALETYLRNHLSSNARVLSESQPRHQWLLALRRHTRTLRRRSVGRRGYAGESENADVLDSGLLRPPTRRPARCSASSRRDSPAIV